VASNHYPSFPREERGRGGKIYLREKKKKKECSFHTIFTLLARTRGRERKIIKEGRKKKKEREKRRPSLL